MCSRAQYTLSGENRFMKRSGIIIFLLLLLMEVPIELPAQDTITVTTRNISVSVESEEVVGSEEVLLTEVLNSEVTDTYIAKRPERSEFAFRPKQLILPLGLIGAGIIVYYSEDYHNLNHHVQTGMTNIRKNRYFHHDDWMQYIPAAAYMGLGFYKGRCKLDFKERILVEATAYISMAAMVNIAKYSFREIRPNSNARNSFPSGHTATVFTGAELIRKEFGWALGGVAYGVATGVALLRLYNNFHWLNDVVAGAGFGILSARIGYWMLPLYRKWFHWDKGGGKSLVTVMPQFSRDNLSVNMLCLF